MTLRSILAAAVFAAACSAPTFAIAQTSTPSAVSVDPERLALAHQLIDGMNLPKMMRGMFDKMFTGMSGSVGGLDLAQYSRSMAVGFESMLPGLIDEEAKVYAEVLSTEDLRQAVAFYQSQAGKDLLATIPAVTDRITPLTYAAMPKMFATVNDDYCKHVKCSDDIRASFKLEENMMATMLAKAPHPAK